MIIFFFSYWNCINFLSTFQVDESELIPLTGKVAALDKDMSKKKYYSYHKGIALSNSNR